MILPQWLIASLVIVIVGGIGLVLFYGLYLCYCVERDKEGNT